LDGGERDGMEASVNIETVRARTVLLDALEALGGHLPSIILVGAQVLPRSRWLSSPRMRTS